MISWLPKIHILYCELVDILELRIVDFHRIAKNAALFVDLLFVKYLCPQPWL